MLPVASQAGPIKACAWNGPYGCSVVFVEDGGTGYGWGHHYCDGEYIGTTYDGGTCP